MLLALRPRDDVGNHHWDLPAGGDGTPMACLDEHRPLQFRRNWGTSCHCLHHPWSTSETLDLQTTTDRALARIPNTGPGTGCEMVHSSRRFLALLQALRPASSPPDLLAGLPRRLVPPPEAGQGLAVGPGPVEGVAVEELAVLHHVSDRVGVVDVLEGILGQDDEVGELARLEAAEVLGVADGLGAVQGGGAEDFQRLPAA